MVIDLYATVIYMAGVIGRQRERERRENLFQFIKEIVKFYANELLI